MDEDIFCQGSGCQSTEQHCKYFPVIANCAFRFQNTDEAFLSERHI